MTKILQINITFKQGSTGKIVSQIHEKAVNSGFESRVFYSVLNSEDLNAIKFEKGIEYFIRRVFNKLFGKSQIYAYFPTKRLTKWIKNYQPDIIHLHVIHHTTVNYIQLFEFLSCYGKPVVFTMHDTWSFTGGCYYYTEIGCNKYMYDCKKCPKNRRYLDCNSVLTTYNLKRKQYLYNNIQDLTFVAVSNWLASEAKKSIISENKIVTIPNGIDTTIFKPNELNYFNSKSAFKEKYIVLGVADNWNERKGFSRFIELTEYLDNKYCIVLVGDYDKNHIRNIPSNMVLWGKTKTQVELAKMYSSASVFINMSLEESFGLVTAEATACGIPIVVFDSSANSEVARKGNGFLIEPGNLKDMANQIKVICEKLNKTSYQLDLDYLRKSLSIENMTQCYIDLYNKLINENNITSN